MKHRISVRAHRVLRALGLAPCLAVLLSCGGGGGGDGGAGGVVAAGGSPVLSSGNFLTDPDFAASGSAGGPGGSAGGASSAGGGTASASAGGDDGSGGVGSGGTGATSADASGVGAADGAGSVIVNGLRYNTDNAVLAIEDAPGLLLGMSAKVSGPVNADFTSGTARRIESAAELRGPVASIDLAIGRFVVMGTTVATDGATVWGDSAGLASLVPGATLQVWGLPATPGVLLATRVEQRAASAPIVTGTVQNLDASARSFTLGGLSVNYGTATITGAIDARPLANGSIVRVRAAAPATAGVLTATVVQWWYPVPMADNTVAQLAGVVTDYAGPSSLRVLGVPVDGSGAQVTGGPAGSVGNGVKVEVGGTFSGGVLRATKLKIRHVPGTGGPSSFLLIGTVGNFGSAASFRVRGQPVDASGPGVVFVNGSAADLRAGAKITVEGDYVINGVLQAARVSFN